MTDQLALIPFEGGVNETSPDISTPPGMVRESRNYSVRAQGGYEWIGGAVQWDGLNNSLRMEALQLLELDQITNTSQYGILSSGNLIQYKYIGDIVNGSNVIAIVEKIQASAVFTVGELFDAAEVDLILTVNPSTTVSQKAEIATILSDYAPSGSNVPTTGEIWRLHSLTGTGLTPSTYVAAIKISGAAPNTATLYSAENGSAGWTTQASLATLPATKTGMRWESYDYKWSSLVGTTAADPAKEHLLFLVNGIDNPHYIQCTEAGEPSSAWNGIADLVAAPYPTHVIVHDEVVFMAYPNGRVRFSDIADPLLFASGTAGEFGVGDTITGFQILPGDSLGIFCQNKIVILNGNVSISPAEYSLEEYSNQSGAINGTLQNLPTTIFCDRQGITTLSASDIYGNFTNKTLSQQYPQLYDMITIDTIVYSTVNREKSQYRIVNENGAGIYLTFANNKFAGAMEVYFGMPVTAMTTMDAGSDVVLIASAGNVFQLDCGPDWDGNNTSDTHAFLRFCDNSLGSPRTKKRFSQIDIDAISAPEIVVEADILIEDWKDFYGDSTNSTLFQAFANTADIGIWSNLNWQNQWRQRVELRGYIQGIGTSLTTYIRPDYDNSPLPHTLNAMVVHYRPRGQKR